MKCIAKGNRSGRSKIVPAPPYTMSMRAGETRGEDDIGQAANRRDQAYKRTARSRPELGVSRSDWLDRAIIPGSGRIDPTIANGGHTDEAANFENWLNSNSG